MRTPIIKYISLLAFGGLIYFLTAQLNFEKPAFTISSHRAKSKPATLSYPADTEMISFPFVENIAGKLFPVLKNLNSM